MRMQHALPVAMRSYFRPSMFPLLMISSCAPRQCACASSGCVQGKITLYRNFFRNLNFKNIVIFFKRTCWKKRKILKTKYIQLITDNTIPYQQFSLAFYRWFLLPSEPTSSDKTQGTDSRRLWLDVYCVQNDRVLALFHYMTEYRFKYKVS